MHNNSVAFVMNTHTSESTRYTNQLWTHIIHVGKKAYGVTAAGLFLLEGATDNGTAINGTATTKETDFGAYQSKRVPYVYLNSDTVTTITPIVDGVTKATQTSSFGGRKTHLARGNAGRYWRFKIDGIVKLEGAEFLPETLQRRIK